jgi:hypothetical protein
VAGATIGRATLPPRVAVPGSLVRRTLGELAALVQVALSGAVVLAAAERPSVLSSPHNGAVTAWFAGPLRGMLPALTRSPSMLERGLHGTLLAMLGAWLVVLLAGGSVRSPVIVGAVVAANVIFLFCPPLQLTDLFNYLGYARLDVLHHLNPYVAYPSAQRGDPVFAYSNWHHLRSPYGPLFTLFLLPTAKLPLPVAYWTYKAIATLGSLGMCAAVWGCARRLGRSPAAAVAFVGLNPIVLVYALGGKHNDVLMMTAVMAGGLLILTGRELRGGAMLAAAVAIKASAGLLVPVIALGSRRPGRAIAGGLAGAVALAAVTYAAFGAHAPDVHDQSRLVNLWSIPNLLGYAAGHGGADQTVRHVATIAGFAGGALCAAVAWRTRRWVTPAGWAALISVASVSWLTAWYVLWALPFAALSRSRTLQATTVAIVAGLLLVRTGTVPSLMHEHGWDVGHTAVWHANHQFERSLIR